jgi:hypothetical protein
MSAEKHKRTAGRPVHPSLVRSGRSNRRRCRLHRRAFDEGSGAHASRPPAAKLQSWGGPTVRPGQLARGGPGAYRGSSVGRRSYYSSDVTIDRINNRMGLSLPGSRPLGAFKPDSSGHPTDRAFYAFLIGQEGERGKTFDLRDKDDRIRRACKLGVDFSAQQGGTVHFLLGGIQSSMNDVVNKRNYSRHGNKDFTASELRYIYRNKERLGNVVQFYDRQLQATEAPWERDPGVWSQYRPHEIHHSWPRTPGSTGAPAGSPQLSPMSSMPATQADSNTLFLSALAQLSRLAQRSASPSPTTEDDGDASTS